MQRGRELFRLAADDYALIPYGAPHAFRNTGTRPARWFEMQAPQPKPPGGWQDTFFVNDEIEWPAKVMPPDFADPETQYLGHFRAQAPIVRQGWIETQAPQFPSQNATRNYADWKKFA